MAFSLIPRQEQFFNYFLALSKQIQVGARTLKQLHDGLGADGR